MEQHDKSSMEPPSQAFLEMFETSERWRHRAEAAENELLRSAQDVERRIVEARIGELSSVRGCITGPIAGAASGWMDGYLEARREMAALLNRRISELRASLADPSLDQASDRVIARLKAMSKDELRQTFIDSGILDEDGKLTEPYRASLAKEGGP